MYAVAQLQQEAGDARSAPRYRLLLTASAAGSAGSPAPVTVHELSSDGLLLESAAALPIGSDILVDLGRGFTVPASVVRQDGALHGCEFQVRLPMHVIKDAIRSSPVTWLSQPSGTAADREPDAQPTETMTLGEPEQANVTLWSVRQRLAFIIAAALTLWALALGAVIPFIA